MPQDQRISSLLELLKGKPSIATLEKLARGFQDLAQDRAEPSSLFVLQTITEKLARELEGEAVQYARFTELISGLPELMTRVLISLDPGTTSDLDDLVSRFYRNVGMFQSR